MKTIQVEDRVLDLVRYQDLVAGDQFYCVDHETAPDDPPALLGLRLLVTDHLDDRGRLMAVEMATGATTWSSADVLCAKVSGADDRLERETGL